MQNYEMGEVDSSTEIPAEQYPVESIPPYEEPPPIITYVTYDADGNLDGYYMQQLQPQHADRYIQILEPLPQAFFFYRANAARDGLELIPPAPPAPPSVSQYSDAVQARLNRGAQDLGYDNILTAASYADEPAVAKFQNEGRALRRWRSLVWEHCQALMAQVQAGTAPYPTIAELIDSLPELDYPVDEPETPAP